MKYQDLVIKDGKLVGKFEDLYQKFEDPWEQSTRENHAYEKKIILEILKREGFKRPLEIGCGHGYYTNKLFETCGDAAGIDISKTAIEKAKKLHPYCSFYESDIENFSLIETINPDCILLIEVSWYVLEKLETFKKFLASRYGNKNIGFVHNLMTYGQSKQQYGKDYFTNLSEIMDFFSDVIDIKEYGELSKKEYDGGRRTFFYGVIK